MSEKLLLENLKNIRFSRPEIKKKILSTPVPDQRPDYQQFNEIQLKRRGASALFVICGIENYRALETFQGELRRHTAVVAEPNLALLRHLLQNKELTQLVKNNNILFICGEAAHQLGDEIEAYFSVAAVDDIFTVPPLEDREQQFKQPLDNLEKFKKTARANQATMEKFLTDWHRFFADNLVDYIKAPPLKNLKNSLGGQKCTVIGPGADLDDNIELLERAANGWMVALDTALPLLLNQDIIPDFVICVDTGPDNMKFLKNFPDQSTLITPAYMQREAIERAENVRFFEPNFPPVRWFQPEVPSPGFLALSGSVATTALDFVRHLNPEECLILGIDLSFKNHLPYSRLNPQYNQLADELDRFTTLPGKIFDILSRYELHTVDSNNIKILTTSRFLGWRDGLEFLIENCDFPVYRPKIGILPLAGTQPVEDMNLDFNKDPLAEGTDEQKEIDREGIHEKLSQFQEELQFCQSELQIIDKMKKRDRNISSRWLELARSISQKEQIVRYFQWEVDRLSREMQDIDRHNQADIFTRQFERWQKLIPPTLKASNRLLDILSPSS
ncbi:MAG: 6-hydroxymethylpterin diphosphokinase MptE-like protein [bacterium]